MTVSALLRPARIVALVTVLSACGSADDAGGRPAAGVGSSSASYTWAQDCGVEHDKHLPHDPGAADDHAYEAQEYVGLPLDEAEDEAEAAGLTLRVLGTDGDCRDRTDDLRQDRVNVYVEDDTVEAAARY